MKRSRYGWISPSGKFYFCNYRGHWDLADEICNEVLKLNSSRDPEFLLEELGYIKLSKPLFNDLSDEVEIFAEKPFTHDQIEELCKLDLNLTKRSENLILREQYFFDD